MSDRNAEIKDTWMGMFHVMDAIKRDERLREIKQEMKDLWKGTGDLMDSTITPGDRESKTLLLSAEKKRRALEKELEELTTATSSL